MADAFKVLARGQLASAAATTLYTVPALTEGLVKSIILTNASASSITVSVYLNGTTDAYIFGVRSRTLGANETLAWEGETIALGAAAYIAVQQSSAGAALSYVITGDEVTP